MRYDFSGTFVEACDCFDLCPCWVDDDPDEGHCTGLVAWRIEEGSIDGVDVVGRYVVAVTAHSGSRRTSPAATIVHLEPELAPESARVLRWAFAPGLGEPDEHGAGVGDRTDPLAALMRVSGTVLDVVEDQPIRVDSADGSWTVQVGGDGGPTVQASGEDMRFAGESDPLLVNNSALHCELQISDESTAQRTDTIEIAVPALPGGGYVSARARSGMRGRFRYRYREGGAGA